VAMGGTLVQTVMKHNSTKIRKLYNDSFLPDLAGAVADAFTFIRKFEEKLERIQVIYQKWRRTGKDGDR